jgi:hypothetical protein
MNFNLNRSLKVADLKAKQEQMVFGARQDMAKMAMSQRAEPDPMLSDDAPPEAAGQQPLEFGPSPGTTLMGHLAKIVDRLSAPTPTKAKTARKLPDGSWVVEEIAQ